MHLSQDVVHEKLKFLCGFPAEHHGLHLVRIKGDKPILGSLGDVSKSAFRLNAIFVWSFPIAKMMQSSAYSLMILFTTLQISFI